MLSGLPAGPAAFWGWEGAPGPPGHLPLCCWGARVIPGVFPGVHLAPFHTGWCPLGWMGQGRHRDPDPHPCPLAGTRRAPGAPAWPGSSCGDALCNQGPSAAIWRGHGKARLSACTRSPNPSIPWGSGWAQPVPAAGSEGLGQVGPARQKACPPPGMCLARGD